MKSATQGEFRAAVLWTATPLSVLALVELAASFAPRGVAASMSALWVALFAVCLIVLAGILSLILALAGYPRHAKGVLAGDGIGLLAMAVVVGILIIAQRVPLYS